MRPIIITELLTIVNDKIVTKYKPENLQGESPILNNGTGINNSSEKEGVRLKVINDGTDVSGKTWKVCHSDDDNVYDGKSLLIQYTALFQLSELKSLPTVITDKVVCKDSKIVLSYPPSNLLNEYPILNFGYAIVFNEDGALVHLPIVPDNEDTSGKTAIIPLSSNADKDLVEGKEITVQYVYLNNVDELVDQTIIVTEAPVFNNGKLTLTKNPGNHLDQESILNFGFSLNFNEDTNDINFIAKLNKVSDTEYELENHAQQDIDLVEGKSMTVQYTSIIKLEDINMIDYPNIDGSSSLFDEETLRRVREQSESLNHDQNDDPNGRVMHFSELGITEEMLRKAREDSERNDDSAFTGSVLEMVDDEDEDDIVDGEFTEVSEEEYEPMEPITTTWSE